MADGRDDKGRTSTKYAAKKAATERIAAQRAAQQRADRKRNLLMAGGGVLAVVVVIGGIVFAGLHSKKGSGASDVVPASSAVNQALASTATSSLAATPDLSTIATPPSVVTGAAALTDSSGVPQVLYVGAEYCPYCAATRWALAVALDRFGTLSGLSTTYSSSTDVDPHTPTLSFRNASYKSSYLSFDGKEQVDGKQQPLQNLTSAEDALFEKYGNATEGATPGYPFIYFGGKWRQNGPIYNPALLKGMTPDQVATDMANAKTKPGAAIQASADVFTSEMCDMDGGKPANVCTAAGVVTATTALASLATSK